MKKGWEIKKLGDVCRFINGKAYSKDELLAEGKYLVLRVGNFFTNNHWYYSDLELEDDKYCDNGDLLYAWSASFGPRIWAGDKVIYHYHIWKVIPNIEIISKEFLFQLLEWDMEQIKSAHGTGTTMMHVGKGSMENRLAPIPPLSDQKQIISILDDALAAIDQAKENLQRNLQNAKELFQSELNNVFTNKGNGWVDKKLGSCFKLKSGDMMTSKMMKVNGKYSVYGGNGISGMHDSYNLSGENIIIGRVGALCGNVRLVKEKIWLTDNAFQVIDFQFDFDYSFLTYLLNFKDLRSAARQSAQPVISNSSLKDIVLQFPIKVQEQKKIVQQLDTLSIQTKNLENIYQKKLDNLEELKKSILHKAFSGELNMKKVKDFA